MHVWRPGAELLLFSCRGQSRALLCHVCFSIDQSWFLVSSLNHKFLQIFKIFWRHPPETQAVSLCSRSFVFGLCLLTYVSYLLKQWCFMWPPKRQKSQKSSTERDFFLSQKDIMQMMVVRRTQRADTQRRKVNLDLLLVLNLVLCVLYGKDRHGSKWQNWEYKQTKQTEHTEWTSQHRGKHRA